MVDALSGCSPEVVAQTAGGATIEDLIAAKEVTCPEEQGQGQGCDPQSIVQCVDHPTPCR